MEAIIGQSDSLTFEVIIVYQRIKLSSPERILLNVVREVKLHHEVGWAQIAAKAACGSR